MKKIISVILCILMLSGICGLNVSAVSVNSSRDELNALFLDKDVGNTDCVYYSPVKGEDDTVKYPLMVWLHGISSGEYPRQQLQWYGFSNWASDEYQARFANAGGCFLFAPRAGSIGNLWTGVTTYELKKLIDEFCEDFKDNIDFSRIYVSGYSIGGDMTWSMLLAYPDFFAAGIPCSAIVPPTVGLSALSDTSVWMVNCDIDFYLSARTTFIKPVFNRLSEVTNRKDGIRLTNLSQAVFAGDYKHNSYQEEHFTWETVTYDMHMADGITPYKYATTTDGNGNTFTFENSEEGVISWLSCQTNERADNGNGASGVIAIFNRILELLKNVFVFLNMQ